MYSTWHQDLDHAPTQLPTMNLLECVERHLGPIDGWPTYILFYLFCKVPISIRVKKLAAFFYGNDVPLNIASYFLHICNNASSVFVTEQMHDWYSIWRKLPRTCHMFHYYYMRHKKFMYINGKCKDQKWYSLRLRSGSLVLTVPAVKHTYAPSWNVLHGTCLRFTTLNRIQINLFEKAMGHVSFFFQFLIPIHSSFFRRGKLH